MTFKLHEFYQRLNIDYMKISASLLCSKFHFIVLTEHVTIAGDVHIRLSIRRCEMAESRPRHVGVRRIALHTLAELVLLSLLFSEFSM